MKDLPGATVLVIAFAYLGCAAPPAQPVAANTPRPEAPAPTAPVSDSVSRADALLAEMKQREEEFKKLEQELPKQPTPAMILDQSRAQATAALPAPAAPVNVVAPSQALAPAAAPTPAKDEAWWKDRMRVLQSRLDSDTMSLAAARLHVQDLDRYVNQDGSMSRTVADNMFKARNTVTQLTAAVLSDEREITNLHEEARRAGVPPGWLRP
jgi:hypothetical protein